MKKFNYSKGSASQMLLALAIVIFVAILIAYFVIRSAERPLKPIQNENGTTEAPKFIYEATVNDIKVTFQEAINSGSVLRGINSTNPNYQKDEISTERFIIVTVGAQNKGKEDTPIGVWNLGNIIDSEGRNFIPASYTTNAWLPADNGCGNILKPEFEPTSCTKIYEVAKVSTGLKIEVLTSKKEANGTYSSGSNKDAQLLDLIITQ
jgi:hypothetical protein